ncbi:shikimate kinase (plasmid) [Bacillus sp. 31A1R]|uniref:Shikimate kinase n=1 Tax=Robertmurraya mangrovi TaxID=3098077 RepID=A0ABU5IV59_9BACI|nr:shikimate kinase [Bacillus sp. 31A1R]MDZ5471023.1 shikimate kinase [Bacillus sp. 31A1R]
MQGIFLVGFMGTGKTTIGTALGERWGLPVYDTDEEIIKKEGISINEIFKRNGEDYFRKLETQILKNVPVKNCIITTGGGVILKKENREYLKSIGKVIMLNASVEEILKRVETDHTRPLLVGDKREKIVNLYKDRFELYIETASIIIETTGKTVNQICEEIEQGLLN